MKGQDAFLYILDEEVGTWSNGVADVFLWYLKGEGVVSIENGFVVDVFVVTRSECFKHEY